MKSLDFMFVGGYQIMGRLENEDKYPWMPSAWNRK